MKIAVIHSANLGFFPRFYQDLCKAVDASKGDEVMAFMPNSGQNRKRPIPRQQLFGYRWNWFVHFNLYKWTGVQDLWSPLSTLDLIRKLNAYKPDVVHLHGILEYCLCIPILFEYLNQLNIPVIWTFHDTRYITARCASFEEDQCLQWKSGCRKCTPNSIYVPTRINNVHLQWKLRKKWFNRLKKLTIVTPSQWLANLSANSFFDNKPILTLNNGIDTSGFSTPKSIEVGALKDVKGKILLGVATGWIHRKGLDTMIWLSQHLPDGYQIVLVGGASEQELSRIPSNIIMLPKTNSKDELIAIYQNASVYVNPTLADNFPTVNIEALGAGLPVVTFNTGGSSECLDETCGISVPKGDNEALLEAILTVCRFPERYTKENCILRSQQFSLSQFSKYVELYHKLV